MNEVQSHIHHRNCTHARMNRINSTYSCLYKGKARRERSNRVEVLSVLFLATFLQHHTPSHVFHLYKSDAQRSSFNYNVKILLMLSLLMQTGACVRFPSRKVVWFFSSRSPLCYAITDELAVLMFKINLSNQLISLIFL